MLTLIELARRGNAQGLSLADIFRPSNMIVLSRGRGCDLWQLTPLGKIVHRRRGVYRTARQIILQLDIIPSNSIIISNQLRGPTFREQTRIDFPQALFKASQPDKDDTNIYESEVCYDREDVDDQLLSEFQVLEVDSIEAGLSAAADSEEESIDSRDVVKTSEDCESHQRAANDVDVWNNAA
jgi:hypothetical protein